MGLGIWNFWSSFFSKNIGDEKIPSRPAPYSSSLFPFPLRQDDSRSKNSLLISPFDVPQRKTSLKCFHLPSSIFENFILSLFFFYYYFFKDSRWLTEYLQGRSHQVVDLGMRRGHSFPRGRTVQGEDRST